MTIETISLRCEGCGGIAQVSAETVDIAEFLRAAIRDGWKEIEVDPRDQLMFPIACDGLTSILMLLTGICAGCAEQIRSIRLKARKSA